MNNYLPAGANQDDADRTLEAGTEPEQEEQEELYCPRCEETNLTGELCAKCLACPYCGKPSDGKACDACAEERISDAGRLDRAYQNHCEDLADERRDETGAW